MDYPVPIEGFAGHEICLRIGNGTRTLLIDDEPAARGPKRNQYVLTRDDGSEVLVKMRSGIFDPVPQLLVDDKVINVAPLLTWYELLWCYLPLGLVFTPGVDGIILAFGGCWANHQVFRSQRPTNQKYLFSAGVTLAAVALYFVLSGRLNLGL